MRKSENKKPGPSLMNRDIIVQECKCQTKSKSPFNLNRGGQAGVPQKPATHRRRGKRGIGNGDNSDDEFNISMSQSIRDEEEQSFAETMDKVCSKFCKNLNPDQERMIILECLRQHIAEYYATKKGSLVMDQT